MHRDDPTRAERTPRFQEVLERSVARRRVLQGGLGAAAALVFGPHELGGAAARAAGDARSLMRFEPVPVAEGSGPMPAISADYRYEVLIPWGEPIVSGGPAFAGHAGTAEAQARQVGIGHDGMHFFPLDGRSDRGLLVINHEFGTNPHVLGKRHPDGHADVLRSQHAHGVSVVELQRGKDGWAVVASRYARRIHVNTPVAFSGPASGHALLATHDGRTPQGTLNNCANGHTPWGTYLTCEENFHYYFGATGDFRGGPREARYGINADGSYYGWHRFDPRFDVSTPVGASEPNRFGWVVEIDPRAPQAAPVKRTALGRFRHEGVAVTVAEDGRLVAYMGDDDEFEFIYKFVSEDSWRALRAAGKSPLDHGRLYAARFDDDRTGQWLELTIEHPRLAEAFEDQAEVLVYAREAASILGATPMDRPEWTTVGPNHDVFCSLTNNRERTRRRTNAANPMAPNRDGHILRWRDVGGPTGERLEWEIFLLAQNTRGTEDVFSNPDGLWADPDGRLFIETDGGQAQGLNNQLLVADTATGELRRLFTGVTGCEITGITTTPDRRTLFVNVQHPGNGDPGETSFPRAYDGVTLPRDATVAIRRKDGGVVGS